jgi:hypothetical protein
MPGDKAGIRLDGADPINNGLVGFWPLTEHGGNRWLDISPFHRSLTTVTPPARIFGLQGRQAQFNAASSQYLQNANFVWPGGRSAAISVWINAPGGHNGSPYDFSGRTLVSGQAFYGHLPFSDNVAYFYYGNSGDGEISANFAAYLNKWTHVAWSSSPTRKAIWINGVLAASSTTVPSSPVTSATNGYIGYSPVSTMFHAGGMRLFRLRTREWSDAEVQRLYRDPWAGTARRALPIAYSPLPPLAAIITGTVDVTASTSAEMALAATIDATIPVTALITAQVESTGDTHDGFVRRSRRERAMAAAEQRRRDEMAQEAVALRLSLEAAIGMAAEVAEEAPQEAIQAATRQAARMVPALADTRPDDALLASAREAVAALLAAVQEAERARALAEDDEEVLMLLRAL